MCSVILVGYANDEVENWLLIGEDVGLCFIEFVEEWLWVSLDVTSLINGKLEPVVIAVVDLHQGFQ